MKKLYLTFFIMFLINLGTILSQTWEQLPYHYQNATVATWRIHSSFDNKLIAGMGSNEGVISYSSDGGTTWQESFSAKSMVTAEFGPDNTIYIATEKHITGVVYNSDTLYKSSDGINWTAIGKAGVSSGITPACFVISQNNSLLFPYQFNSTNPYDNLNKSTDNGDTWTFLNGTMGNTQLGSFYGKSIACSNNADTIVIGTYNSGVRYSHDGGQTFSNATGGNWGASTIGQMLYTLNGDFYGAGLGMIYKSMDGGVTFTSLSPNPWISMNIAELLYAQNGKFYFYGIYGIFESTDCISWTKISDNLPDNTLIRDIDISNDYLYAVTDTNLYRYSIGSTTAIEKKELKSFIDVYPNPSFGDINIVSENAILSISVTDILGTILCVKNFTDNGLNNIELHNLFGAPGIYMVHVTDELNKVFTKRILVE